MKQFNWMINKSSKKIIFLLAVLSATVSFGQFIPPPPPPPPPGLPIDGGIFILAIVGAIYGIKKLRK